MRTFLLEYITSMVNCKCEKIKLVFKIAATCLHADYQMLPERADYIFSITTKLN